MMTTVALSTLALLWIRDRTGEDIDRITSEELAP